MRSVKRSFLLFSKKFFRVTVTVNRKREKKEPKKRENLFFKRLKRIKKHIYARFLTVTVTVTVTVRVTVRVTVTVTK